MHTYQWFVFRLPALYGRAGCLTKGGSNFVEKMLNQAALREPIRMVKDLVNTPTSTLEVARYLRENLESLEPGLYHLANAEACTWDEFAEEYS